jgi:lipopolysaccharide biosynthesis protein
MAKRGIDIQYCMALPKHFLQSTNYSNVTNIRTSQDRFGADLDFVFLQFPFRFRDRSLTVFRCFHEYGNE